jgi:hypothetical protein
LLSIVDRLSGSACAAIVTVDPAIILAAYAALNMIVLSVRKGSWRQITNVATTQLSLIFIIILPVVLLR